MRQIGFRVIMIVLLALAYAMPLDTLASQHNHETDMHRLMEYCKTHTKEECHNLHAQMHMKHHGGTKEDFQKHYEEEHGKEKGKTHKNAY